MRSSYITAIKLHARPYVTCASENVNAPELNIEADCIMVVDAGCVKLFLDDISRGDTSKGEDSIVSSRGRIFW